MRDGYRLDTAELETLRQRVAEAQASRHWVGELPRILAELDGRP